MANFRIDELSPAGAEFFNDSENFLEDLTDEELNLEGGYYQVPPSLVNVNVNPLINVQITQNNFQFTQNNFQNSANNNR
jgi:hypothetical protein